MAQVNFAFSDLEELINITKEEAIETLTMLGFPAEETADGGLTVEVTPNRPDALCVEGLARALKSYLKGEGTKYSVAPASVEVTVDPSVADVRPAFGCAIVRGLRMTDSFLRSIMQVQEKLHETLGRKRRKVAIGIHDLGKVQPPFRYFACGNGDVSFIPLERSEKMTPNEILRRHDKGMAYAHLVGEKCPMITDRNGDVLSFPPIINGELTKLTEATENVFIDTTGTSEEAVRQAVNILVAMLSERGGRIEEVKVNDTPYRLLQEKKWALPVKESGRLLGVKLERNEVASLLAKMGYRVEGDAVFAPGYRADVINEVDLIEDVAIAYGFNDFDPVLPEFSSIGGAGLEPPYHELLIGLGYDEVMSWNLANRKLAARAQMPESGAVEIENPLTGDFTIFRQALLPNLLAILAESKNERLPIKLYEIGTVGKPELKEKLCFVSMHPKASFSEVKGALLALMDTARKQVEIRAEESGQFIEGRCAAVYIDGERNGYFGEISPKVLHGFGIEQPVCACEIIT
jgi:phenylalanyl-tRNA synthetase beta chain